MLCIYNNNTYSACKIQNCHKRNHLLTDLTDAFNSTYQDHQCQCCDHYACHNVRNLEGAVQSVRNRIGLCHVADSERCQDREDSKKRCHHCTQFFVFKTVFHGIHRAANHLAVCVHFPVFYSENALRVFGGKPEESRDPHPDDRAGTAHDHGSGNTHNIAGTYGCRKSGHQRLERCDITFPAAHAFLVGIFKNRLQRKSQIAPWQKIQPNGKKNSCTHQQYQHKRAPYKIIHCFQYYCKIHTLPPSHATTQKGTDYRPSAPLLHRVITSTFYSFFLS